MIEFLIFMHKDTKYLEITLKFVHIPPINFMYIQVYNNL